MVGCGRIGSEGVGRAEMDRVPYVVLEERTRDFKEVGTNSERGVCEDFVTD